MGFSCKSDESSWSGISVTAIILGGLPAVKGSQFTVVPESLTPANAALNNSTALNGGDIFITGLTNVQNYSFQVTDGNGCPHTVTVTFTGSATATFSASIVSGCSPLTVTFTNSSSTRSTDCNWTFSDGSMDVGCGTIVHTFVHPGCYDVSLNLTVGEN